MQCKAGSNTILQPSFQSETQSWTCIFPPTCTVSLNLDMRLGLLVVSHLNGVLLAAGTDHEWKADVVPLKCCDPPLIYSIGTVVLPVIRNVSRGGFSSTISPTLLLCGVSSHVLGPDRLLFFMRSSSP